MTTGRLPGPNGIQPTIVNAKGDLIVGTADDSVSRLAVGANNLVLTADSAEATGMKWAAPDPLTTKGDLFTYSTTEARLGVGNNGESLVADSSTTTGLRWQGNFAAGKNAIINGDFRIWQRGTSFSVGATNTYCADRFMAYVTGATATVSQQSFTPGTAPVSGYESPFFLRIANGAGGTYYELQQRIEDVRTFAGQTITFSFWAKASTTTTAKFFLVQNFGSGGSSNVSSSDATAALTTSWQRFTLTTTLGSMSGKTIGAGSYLAPFFYYSSGTISSVSIDTWGWQVEAGNTATAFQTATGTLQGELAACQRYYQKSYPQGTAPATALVADGIQVGKVASNTIAITERYNSINLPVVMRTAPTVTIRPYSTPANTGRVSSANSGADLGANSGTAQFIADKGFSVYNNSGGTLTTTDLAVIYHFEASAEL